MNAFDAITTSDSVLVAMPEEIAIKQDADLLRMNKKYAIVKVGGKTRVASLEESDAYPGSLITVYSTIADFKAFHANPRREIIGRNGRPRSVGLGEWWINHPKRRQYTGIVYAPNGDCGSRLNLWSGFAYQPKPGKCDLYLRHVRKNICGDNEEYEMYLIGWMANAVQNPGKPGEVAIVLRGREGTGKGIFAKEFGRLFGPHFKHITHGHHLTGHFNRHLEQCSVLFADEAFFAGDRSHESVLKGLITEETILVEPKGLDSYSARNCIHLIMASNNDWVVPAGADARRYFVLDVSDAKIQDWEYFAAIAAEMDNGGREALLHHLQNLELNDFNLRKIPGTPALADQKMRSRHGIDGLVERVAEEGILPSSHSAHSNIAITSGEEKGDGFYHQVRKIVPDLKFMSSIVIKKTLKAEWGCEDWKSGYRRGIKFPPLAELRAKFDRKHGPQDWSNIGDWERPESDWERRE